MLQLWFLVFSDLDGAYLGSMYCWGADEENAIAEAQRAGAPDPADIASTALDPALSHRLPVGFIGRLLTLQEADDALLAVERAARLGMGGEAMAATV